MMISPGSPERDKTKNGISESEKHFEQWRKLVVDASGKKLDFLNIFNTAQDVEESYRSGWLDFSYHILKPEVLRLLGDPGGCDALEIGYGAGRLISPASHYFKRCIGVDIHPLRNHVEELIKPKTNNNVSLFQTDGRTIPIEDGSVDFVYSFIVLQHLPYIDVLKSYLSETKRILRATGVAILYFGYLPGRFTKKYSELGDQKIKSAREITLKLTMPYGKKLVRDHGFKVVKSSRSRKRPWSQNYGGQFFQIITPQ